MTAAGSAVRIKKNRPKLKEKKKKKKTATDAF